MSTHPPTFADRLSLEEIEIVPLPNDRATRKDPIWIETTLDAWPNQRLRFSFDWNNAIGRWIWHGEHVGYDDLFRQTTAQLNRPHVYRDYLFLMFFDPSGVAERITPQNLGKNVQLAAFPGPRSPAFPYPVDPQ